MGKCRKCGCDGFFWNFYSAAEALRDRWNRTGSGPPTAKEYDVKVHVSSDGKEVRLSGRYREEYGSYRTHVEDSRYALRACTCGHHYNYH